MELTSEEWAVIKRAAKYTNGIQKTRRQELDALHALHALVKRVDARASSTSQDEPIRARAAADSHSAPSP